MPELQKPRRLALSRSRRLTMDVLHYNRRMPICAHDRRFDLQRVAKLRSELPTRISWSILFIKAFALVAQKHRVLRQSYIEWPWPHVLEHPHSVGMLATEREHRGERWLFWSNFTTPESRELTDLQTFLNSYQSRPVEKVFLQQWRLSGLPTFLRRWFWWWTLNFAGARRAKRVGTFFLTTLAGKGVEIQDPPAFLTSNLTYGPLDESGHCRVTLSYDHRLMDGSTVADCLIDLEAVLNGQIALELEEMLKVAGRSAA
jgi:hypothetical protein